jgi:tetratricopeptide (TPR) repeat protein
VAESALTEVAETSQHVAPDWEGRVVSHYEVTGRLGGGGMGVVYRARDTRLGREVALKFLHPASSRTPQTLERFQREASAVSLLNHPNICTLYDVGTHEGHPFLVLELLEGTTLKELLRKAPLPAHRVAELGAQIADALDAAHGKGIVHRDIKPGNVWLTPRGQVKVLDFGLAKLVSGRGAGDSSDTSAPTEHALTEVGVTVGTLAYMSPEQLLGLPLDGRADLFSLGAVLHELATGRPAFGAATASAIREAILHRDPGSGPGGSAEAATALQRVTARALEKDPGKRYATAAEMRSDLRGLAMGDATVAGRPAPPAVPLSRRRGVRVGLVVAAAVAMAAAAFVAGRNRAGPVAVESAAVVAVLPLDQGQGADDLGLGAADILITSLARVPGLNVLSRSSTQPYRGRGLSPAQLARELGVDYLVEGAVERAGDTVRMTLTLVRANGVVAWSESYEGGVGDLFELQRRAATALARTLRPGQAPPAGLSLPASAAGTVETMRLYSQAQALLERPDVPGNVEGAVARLEKAVAAEPRFALAQAALGDACWERYRATHEAQWATRARGAVEEALRLDPDQPLVQLSLATIDEGTGRLEEARSGLEALILRHPDNDEAHRLLGRVLQRLGRGAEALARLQKAVSLRPGFWRNHQQLGVAHLNAGRHAAAIASFRRIIELQPDLAWGHEMLGTVHHMQGDLPAAIQSYERAIELGPDALAWSNLGAALYTEGRMDEAVRAFEQAIALEPLASANHRNLGDAWQRLGRLDAARRSWSEAARLSREALRVNPRSSEALGQLAACEAKLGDHASAESHARQALDLAPDDPDAHYRAAVVHALGGKADAAVEALARALERGYSRSVARDDDDLSTLRSRSDFQSLVAQPHALRKGAR